jgi:hypothetical protein
MDGLAHTGQTIISFFRSRPYMPILFNGGKQAFYTDGGMSTFDGTTRDGPRPATVGYYLLSDNAT